MVAAGYPAVTGEDSTVVGLYHAGVDTSGPDVDGNAYWDRVRQWAGPDPLDGGVIVGGWLDFDDPDEDTALDRLRAAVDRMMARPAGGTVGHPFIDASRARPELVRRYACTITDPDTVAFVAEHCGPAVLDPLAASGWWARLLADRGADVAASDLRPPDTVHHPVTACDAVTATRVADPGRTLLLSWPPFKDRVGADILDVYRGNRVVYMGETGGSCGDQRMTRILADGRWRAVGHHRPVCWLGMRDQVVVYDRVNAAAACQLYCYGRPVGVYPSWRLARAAAEDHIRCQCPNGPAPWARRIRWYVTTSGWCSAAGGGWLNHLVELAEPGPGTGP